MIYEWVHTKSITEQDFNVTMKMEFYIDLVN